MFVCVCCQNPRVISDPAAINAKKQLFGLIYVPDGTKCEEESSSFQLHISSEVMAKFGFVWVNNFWRKKDCSLIRGICDSTAVV